MDGTGRSSQRLITVGVRAALRIREAVAEMNQAHPDLDLQVRIAVNTGEAIVALGARTQEGESMVAGDVVNTASRLQQAAPVNGVITLSGTGQELRFATGTGGAQVTVRSFKGAIVLGPK